MITIIFLVMSRNNDHKLACKRSVFCLFNFIGASSVLGLSKEDYRTLTSLVLAAIEGEDCIEKMMCDAGKLVKKVKKADTFLR